MPSERKNLKNSIFNRLKLNENLILKIIKKKKKVVGECAPQELTTIGNRLLDWFSVIMTDTKKQKRRIAKSEGNYFH